MNISSLRVSSGSLLDAELGYVDPERAEGVAVEVQNGNFTWNPNSKEADLTNINFTADAGNVDQMGKPGLSGRVVRAVG